MTSADLLVLAKFLTAHHWPDRAATATWAANEIDVITAQVAAAATTSAQQNAAIANLQSQVANDAVQITQQAGTIASLQIQLAVTTSLPMTFVVLGTHLYGFTTTAGAEAFVAANPAQTPMNFFITDWTWNPVAHEG